MATEFSPEIMHLAIALDKANIPYAIGGALAFGLWATPVKGDQEEGDAREDVLKFVANGFSVGDTARISG
jgi:hypothetical protein